MWILKSRRSRTRVLYLLGFLFGTTIVAATSMLGSSLLSLKNQSSRASSEHLVALALLEAMDEVDHSTAASDPSQDAAGDRFVNDASAGPMVTSADSTDDEVVDDDPAPIVAGDTSHNPPKRDDSDTSSDLPDEQEEYAGARGMPPSGLDTPDSGPRNGGAPQAPYTPSSPPIAGLPPISAPRSGPPPTRGPAPTAPPVVIASTPPAAPFGPTGPAPASPQTPTYAPPVVVTGTPTAAPSAPPASPGARPGSNDPLAKGVPGHADPGPVIASNPPGESGGPTADRYSPGSSPGVDHLSDFRLGGRTLVIEFVSSEPGLGFDVLQVDGTANLDYGNIVFAFLNDYRPDENVMYEFLQAGNIVWGDRVDFYYGVLNSSQTEEGPSAPLDWNLYSQILDEKIFSIFADDGDGRSQTIDGREFFYGASLALDVIAWQTLSADQGVLRIVSDPDPITRAISPGAANTVPSPDVLNLLLSGGLGLLLVTFIAKRRQNARGQDQDNQAG